MESGSLALLTALWLGMLTSVSPCPLATNIAAVSYIGRRLSQPRWVLLAGALYIAGRMLVYVALGIAAVWSLLSIVSVSSFLQDIFFKLLGPLLILVGMFLLDLLSLKPGGKGISEGMQQRVDRWGVWGAGLLGVITALSFCPVSAALFFGSLIPLAAQHNSALLMPSLYGLGTGLPVCFFSVAIALGVGWLGRAFHRISSFERWARRVTGVVFILVGVYETLRGIFGVI